MLAQARRRIVRRITSHERGRALVEWWNHRQTQAYLLSYPKCGRTWLRLMIGKALDEHYRLGVTNPMEIGRMHRLEPRIPRIRVSHDEAFDREPRAPAELERSKERYRDKTILFLVRDPRDVVVSSYFEFSRRRGVFSGTLPEFLRAPRGSIDTILEYYNIWAENQHVPRRFHLVRYEDLHLAPGDTLQELLRVAGVDVSRPAIDAAVEFSAFEKMRKMEAANAFGSRRLRPGDAEDKESFKTRRGKVRGYAEYLEPADIEYLDRRVRERLDPFYGSYRDEHPRR